MSLPAAIGVARLARFRADGLALFDASPSGLLAALTPWFAFALVGFLLVLARDSAGAALGELLGTTVALLTPPVLSHALARRFGREEPWLRYAVAFTWAQWVMPPALLVASLGSGILLAAGLPDDVAEMLGALALLAYALALHGFIARHALALSPWRTAAFVAIVNVGTGIAFTVPVLIQGALEGPA
jgi:hypothetical protein